VSEAAGWQCYFNKIPDISNEKEKQTFLDSLKTAPGWTDEENKPLAPGFEEDRLVLKYTGLMRGTDSETYLVLVFFQNFILVPSPFAVRTYRFSETGLCGADTFSVGWRMVAEGVSVEKAYGLNYDFLVIEIGSAVKFSDEKPPVSLDEESPKELLRGKTSFKEWSMQQKYVVNKHRIYMARMLDLDGLYIDNTPDSECKHLRMGPMPDESTKGVDVTEELVRIDLLTMDSSKDIATKLVAYLGHEDVLIREKALYALTHHMENRFFPLIELAYNSKDPWMEVAAIRAACHIWLDNAIGLILKGLSSQHETTKLATLKCFDFSGYKPAAKNVVKLLEDKSERIRMAAIDALLWVGTPEILPSLFKLAKSSDVEIRRRIGEAIYSSGWEDDLDLDFIIEMTRDEDQYVAWHYVRKLGLIKHPKAIIRLTELLTHKEKYIRAQAAVSLKWQGDVSAVPSLKKVLPEKLSEFGLDVAGTLLKTGESGVGLEYIKRALQSEEDNFRMIALEQIGYSKRKDLEPLLKAALGDSNLSIRLAAAAGLRGLDDDTALKHLKQLLEDPNSDVKIGVIDALQGLGRKSVPVLLGAVDSRDCIAAGNSIRVLGEIGDTSVVPKLLEKLKDSEEYVFQSILVAFMHLRDMRTLPALREIAETQTGYTKDLAEEAIHCILNKEK